ncbi:hypothetical protein OsI_38985 [Oryza sativa Indica Group]|uniref:K Homology domain-containing protein n=1 Tax=Oryza sativa subsp. indica TaxID=39946 RepID=B8BMU2_ORYSI|nr:hypothetical protein OsI_38985 [Oryza sativa Indica Group]
MDGNIENPAEDMSGIASNLDNEEQAIPLSDVPEQYKEDPENTYDEETKDSSYEESGIPYNEDQVNINDGNVGHQHEEDQAIPSEEGHAYGGEAQGEQQANAVTDEKKWPGWPGESVFRILVPAQKVGAVIGRKGEFIKKMCEESRARIKVLDGPPGVPDRASFDYRMKIPVKKLHMLSESVPPVALSDDRVVEIQGEPLDVHKAVELIASHLRKFLVDRSVLPLFEMQMKVHNAHREQPMPPPQTWGPPPPWGHPSNVPPGGPGYGGNPQFMPPRPQDHYYPPPDVPPVEKQPHYGISSYGRDAPPTGAPPASGNQHPPHGSSQITHSMQVPLSYADAVIGAAGASISYIRRHSGATISIQEGVPGEMTVEISGSASQVQTAQQLIKLLPKAPHKLLLLLLNQSTRATAPTHRTEEHHTDLLLAAQVLTTVEAMAVRHPPTLRATDTSCLEAP